MQTIDAPKPKNEDEDEITRIDLYAEQAVRIAPILICSGIVNLVTRLEVI